MPAVPPLAVLDQPLSPPAHITLHQTELSAWGEAVGDGKCYFYVLPACRDGVDAGVEGAFARRSPRRGIFVLEERVGFVAAAFLEC